MAFVIVVIVIVVFGVAIVGAAARKRSAMNAEARAVQEVARRYGWSYQRSDPRWVNVISGTPPAAPMVLPRKGTVLNVVEANLDGTVVTFFHLLAANAVRGRGAVGLAIEAGTKNPTEHTYCVLALPAQVVPMTVCPPGDWAARRVRPEGLTNRCSSGDPVFDQQFVLTSAYPAEAAQALTPELKQFVSSTWTPFTVGETGHLLTWRKGRVADGEQLVAQGRALAHVAAHLLHR